MNQMQTKYFKRFKTLNFGKSSSVCVRVCVCAERAYMRNEKI